MEALETSRIPTIELTPFIHHQNQTTHDATLLSKQKTVAEALKLFCHTQGCVAITGHGIPTSYLREAFRYGKELFDLPMEDKMKAPHPKGPVPHRGYSAPGLEKAYTKEDLKQDFELRDAKRKVVDYKESFEVGSQSNEIQYNIWLPEKVLPHFKEFSLKLYWDLHKVCLAIIDLFGLSLELSKEEIESIKGMHSGHNNQLRFLHYPPVNREEVDREVLGRLPAHTDWSSFTLLFQDSCGGLEFEDRENRGTYMPAVPDGDALFLNVGDMLMRLSNNFYPSATHRVTLPDVQYQTDGIPVSKMTPARYSIPYFFLPDDNAVIKPLNTCCQGEGNKPKFEETTLAKYGAWMSKWQYESQDIKAEA